MRPGAADDSLPRWPAATAWHLGLAASIERILTALAARLQIQHISGAHQGHWHTSFD